MRSFLTTRFSWRLVLAFLGLSIVFRVISGDLAQLREQRGVDLDLLLPLITLGLFLSWGLAASRITAKWAGPLTWSVGLTVIIVRVGQLTEKITLVFSAWLAIINQFLFNVLYAWQTQTPLLAPDLFPIQSAWYDLRVAVGVLTYRFILWLGAISARRTTTDPVAAALVWSVVVWFIVTYAAWHIRRNDNPLRALFPSTIVIGAIAYLTRYQDESPLTLLVLLSVILFLLAFNAHDLRERFWKQVGIDYFEEAFRDLAFYVVPISFALIVLASIIPSISIPEIVRNVNDFFTSRSDAVSTVTQSLGLPPVPAPPNVFDEVRSPGLPNSHLMSGKIEELSKEIAMYVSTGDFAPRSPESLVGVPMPRYYWRSITYDQYSGHGWYASDTREYDYGAGQSTRELKNLPPAQRVVKQNVQVARPLKGLMFNAGELLSADQDFRVAWRTFDDIFGATISTDKYSAVSLVSTASESDLRAAGEDYPQYIFDRYLTLPKELPTRVRSLARDLTATSATPYDRAVAIEKYLRQFPYTLDVYAPPPSMDAVDYFLFELKTGYCDYYATSMVVLTRAAGLPARLVTGYASGKYDAQQARYIVTQADAHSWVEVYFPNYGWVEFEPTGNRQEIERAPEAVTPESSTQTITNILAEFKVSPTTRWLMIPLIGLLGSLVVWLGWLAVDAIYLQRLSAPDTAYTLYQRLRWHARRLNVPLTAGDTPLEFANKLAVLNLAEPSHLIDYYIRLNYLPDASTAPRATILRTWYQLRLKLWWLWFKQRWLRRFNV